MCVHLSRLDRLDGLVCSFCEDGGKLASAEVAARYGSLNVMHGRRRARRRTTARGVARFLTPYLIVIVGIWAMCMILLFVESTVTVK